MKKWICILTAGMLLTGMIFTGCSKKQAQTNEDAQAQSEAGAASQNVVGGWTIDTDSEPAALPDAIQEAFDMASATLLGNDLVPVAAIGEQVVAGMNYSVLCRSTPVTANPVTGLSVVTIYMDLNEKATISNIADFSIADYSQKEDAGEMTGELAGGWSVPESSEAAKLPQKVQSAFEKAMSSFEGNDLNPVAYLGHQIVSGTNYAILCRSTTVEAEPMAQIQIVFIYEDLEGNASVTNLCTVDAGAYSGN